MDIKEYFLPIIKWWWLLVIAAAVAAIASFISASQRPPVYQAATTLSIGRAIDDPNPTNSQFSLSQQLAATYADMANREPVRDATMNTLGIDNLPQYLARPIPNTQLIEIIVTSTNPALAQAIANELANQLILRSPTAATPEDQARQEFIANQLDDLQVQIEDTQNKIQELQDTLGTLTSALQIQETQNQLAGQQSKLNSLQTTYSNLFTGTQQGATNTITVVEPASLPTRPIPDNKILTILFAAGMGLILAITAAYFLEYLDQSLKSPEQTARVLGAEVIGYIPEMSSEESKNPNIADVPRSFVAEAYRSLRTNIEIAARKESLKTIFVTSASPAVGKTSISVNLAIIMAQGGSRVVLIDADMRRPNIHGYVGVTNREGLRDVLEGKVEVSDVTHNWLEGKIDLITAGSPPSNPTDLIGSNKMGQILSTLEEEADWIIIDGPPFLVSDASVLSSLVDGILVVVRPGFTHREAALTMMDQIHRVNARVIGITFNRIPPNRMEYYGKNWFYAPEYRSQYMSADEEAESEESLTMNGKTKKRRSLPVFIKKLSREPDRARQGLTEPLKMPSEDRSKSGRMGNKASDGTIIGKDNKPAGPKPLLPPKPLSVLNWVDNIGKHQKLVLRDGDTILIGRDRINDIVLYSRHVSRRHAVVTFRKKIFEIADLGSTNGTYVNGVAADRPIELTDGDVIRLFDVELNYQTLNKASEPTSDESQEPALK